MRRKKKILIAVGSSLAFVSLLVLLAPTLLSGYARGVVEEQVGARVNGTVKLKALELSWFSGQRVDGLAIDGGADVGQISVSAGVSEGLLALARGSDITLKLEGSAATVFDKEGKVGLAKLAKASSGVSSGVSSAASSPAPAAAQTAGNPLGTRKLKIELAGLDFAATGPDGAAYALQKLDGDIELAGADLSVALDAVTKASGREGELSIDAKAALAFANGGVDIAATSGTATISASKIAWPTAAGELNVSSLRVDAAKSKQGDVTLKADVAARVAASSEATVHADIALGSPFDASGKFTLDPATVTATVEARAVPLGAFQAFAPEIAPGTKLDFAKDIGDTADLTIVKRQGDGARIALDARQIKCTFDGAVATDGSSVNGGTLALHASLRPELLKAFGLVDANALAINVNGDKVAWKKGDDAVRSVGGTYAVELAAPFDFRMDADPVRLHADKLKVSFAKELGAPAGALSLETALRCGETGTTTASLRGNVDLASKALLDATLEANAKIDPAFLERVTSGNVVVSRTGASLAVSVTEFAYIPSDEFSGIRAVVGRARAELSGAVAVNGGGASAVVNDVRLDVLFPRGGKPGTLDLGAKIDGAQTRVQQQFGPLAAGPLDLNALKLSGTVDINGVDPAMIARLAPSAAGKVGLLGRGPMRLEIRDRSEGRAMLADFVLDATAVDASGAVRYEADAISASNIAVDATLTAEGLASLELGDKTEIEPGATVGLRVPMLALARTESSKDGAKTSAWSPSGDLALRAVVQNFRVLRAPGLSAPIGIAKLDASASYAFKDERATANGKASLGGGGTAGDLGFGIVWKKPAEAKLFGGVEGDITLDKFDLARFEPSFGLEAGAYSGMLGGPGSARITLSENGEPKAAITLDFPKTKGAIELRAPEQGGKRVAQVSGRLTADIDADTVGKLAGMARDAKRRVTAPVSAELKIASASVPLDSAMKPLLADGAMDISGSLSPLALEIVDAAGAKSTVSSGALALTIKSTRLADEVAVRVTSKATDAAAGTLDVDAHVRGAVPNKSDAKSDAKGDAKANPVLDAKVTAVKFPSATVDALAATGGAVQKYVGDAIDARIEARELSASSGALSASVSSKFATLEAPAIALRDGFLSVSSEKPISATFALSPAVKQELLATINPVFSDITTGAPAKFTLSSMSWPLDGDKSKFDAAFTLETGEVRLANSGGVSGMLSFVGAGRTDGLEALLDPLRATVKKGRLTYEQFALHAGKTAQNTWRNSLLFKGDIDLAAKPMRVNAIDTVMPLSDVANWSKDARNLLDSLAAASPELVKSLAVGVELSGPLFDVAGKSVPLSRKLKLPDIGTILKDNPGAILDAAGSVFDAIKGNKKKNEPAPPPAPRNN